MKTQYYVLNHLGRMAKTNGRVISVVAGSNTIVTVKSRNIKFVFGFRETSMDHVPIINKVLSRHGILLCKNCGRDHSSKFTYCPWCGQCTVSNVSGNVDNNGDNILGGANCPNCGNSPKYCGCGYF